MTARVFLLLLEYLLLCYLVALLLHLLFCVSIILRQIHVVLNAQGVILCFHLV